jgi:hypothetical protein
LVAFPDSIGAQSKCANLKKLNLDNNFFDRIPDGLCELINLEELSLNNALGMLVEPLPDLSPLRWLRKLSFGGGTCRWETPVPPHSLLRPLFAMDLANLEELSIFSWGVEKAVRGSLTTGVIAGIGSFRKLRVLNLSSNGLTCLPDDLYTLPALETINLTRNALDEATRQRLAETFPRAEIRY